MPPTFLLLAVLALPAIEPGRPFAITVVDDQTGRGVPLVELTTVNEVLYVTDSAGVAAVDEPGLMNTSVYFRVKSHGYEFAADGFGFRGEALTLTEGGSATLKVRRVNVAERTYRVTGAGIYRDSVLTGRSTPLREPVLNARVFGSDSVLTARYRGKLYWFWGDTNRPDYPLGNYHTPGATSELPGRGGLEPDVGVDFSYFVDEKTGFARPTARLPGDGPTWLTGLAAFRDDDDGAEQLVAGYAKVKPNMETYEHGLVAFDPGKNAFEKVATFPLDSPLRPKGHTYQRDEGGTHYIYYCTPFPLTRVRARLADLKDVTKYEGFSPLKTGNRRVGRSPDASRFDLGPDGAPRYAWRPDTAVLTPPDEQRLVRDEAEGGRLLDLRDVETGSHVSAHAGSVSWNAYRNRWVMITAEVGGRPSYLGEVWYAEADTPLGPWAYARKVVTHDRYSFYNPLHHPEFDKDGGRVIYFEGTYTHTFSGNDDPTPRYDYNQVMYRLDLADPRLNLPVPVYLTPDGAYATGADAARAAGGAPPAFFAPERPGPGLVAVYRAPDGLGAGPLPEKAGASFYALPDAPKPPALSLPIGEVIHKGDLPAVRVWRAATRIPLPSK